MAIQLESITDPAITQELADQLLAAGRGNPTLRRLVHVLRSRTVVLALGERAGAFDIAGALREVAEQWAYTERELAQVRKAGSGHLVTFSGRDVGAVRLMQTMLTEASRRLVLADREARRLWDCPEFVDWARSTNADLIEHPRGASESTRARWMEWRNRNLQASRAA